MRTTVTIDDDVAALLEAERSRTGESFRETLNRLLRRAARPEEPESAPPLPLFPGGPMGDISDVSAVLAELDDEKATQAGLY
jgi:hypothetical protein